MEDRICSGKLPERVTLRQALSVKEEQMFIALGYDHLLGLSSRNFAVQDLYQTAALDAFSAGTTSPAVESLRRTWNAVKNMTEARHTFAFDDLINLEDKVAN